MSIVARVKEIKEMIQEKRIGFKADEIMSGMHHFAENQGPAGEFPFEFRVTWGNKHLLCHFLNPLTNDFFCAPLEGFFTIGGLLENVPCSGVLQLRYFQEAKLRYIIDFEANGIPYQFIGEKVDVKLYKPWKLPKTHTTCYGTVKRKDTDTVISHSITYFTFNRLPEFLLSFRLA